MDGRRIMPFYYGVIIQDVNNYLHPELLHHNKKALSACRPWLLIKAGGIEPWLGPLFIPGKTACFQCLQYYLARNYRIESFVAQNNLLNHSVITGSASFQPHLNI